MLKRVVELKKAGLWSANEGVAGTSELLNTDSTPSMSSLAPPPENASRVFSDYLFAELRWLAEDFKRERQWKKSSAKKVIASYCLNLDIFAMYFYAHVYLCSTHTLPS